MTKSTTVFQHELSIPLLPVIQSLIAIGLVLAVTSEFWYQVGWTRFANVGLLLAAGSACAWWSYTRWPALSRWLVLLTVTVTCGLAYWWIGAPILWVLLILPPLLAVALTGLSAGLIVAGLETLYLLMGRFEDGALAAADLVILLIALWGTVAVGGALLHEARRALGWSWRQVEQNQQEVEGARDRQLQLNQVLADLAHANEQLTRLNQLAQRLRQEAEEARHAKAQFVANVSHELRTPLNMIIGFSEIMLQAPESYGRRVPPALLADLTVIHRNAEHLSALINDVLDLSQIEAGEMAITRTSVDFAELIASAITAARPLFDSKQLYLRSTVAADLPPVNCDPTRMREVLLNLLSNAGRFTEQGGVEIRAERQNGSLTVAVADTGAGIPADGLTKLFQPFFQLDSSLHRRNGGTGLGLSICKRFIELHEGKIWVESQPNQGTTFFFSLPLGEPAAVDETFLRGLTPDWEHYQRTRPSVAPMAQIRPRLVVLESEAVLQRLLDRYWHQVETVGVADLAAAQAELARAPAQALLINQPSVSAALEDLSLAAALPAGLPALICSIPGLEQHALELGATQLLVKPVTQATLLAALARLGIHEGTILIVDDEPDALQLFGRMLTSAEHSHRILLARDGYEALEILAEVRPAVILLDLIMPNLDGFQLLAVRSRDPVLAAIPVIVISAQDPTRQPIVSNALAITKGGGLSMRQLLQSIEFVATQLTPSPGKTDVT